MDRLPQIRGKLDKIPKIIEINMKKVQRKQKHIYDKKAKECTEVGDEVLVNRPTKKGKLKRE